MKNLLFALLVLCGVAGCRSATSPEGTGSLAGRVVLFDSSFAPMNDHSGVLVQVDGTGFKTLTDASGSWLIRNIPEGIHDITASKPGFGAFHWYEQPVSSGVLTLRTVELARMSSRTIHLIGAEWNFEGDLVGAADSSETNVETCYYFDLDSTVNPQDAHFLVPAMWIGYGFGGNAITRTQLLEAGVKAGQQLFVSASAVFSGSLSTSGPVRSFFDPIHQETRWASTGPKSNVIAVTMP